MNRIHYRPGLALVLALACLASCGRDNSSKRSDADGSDGHRRDSSAGSVDLGSTSYRPAALSAVGSIAGTVRVLGGPSADTSRGASGQPACDVADEPDVDDDAGDDQANTVVWIADPRRGKALPIDRRVEITTEHCEIDPRVQTVVVGSGINVLNEDQLLHKLAFVRAGTDDTLAVMPFFNEGQIVANDALARQAGVIEIRCAQHGWMHGYILVFDHPYYALTSSDGRFRIDSLAPGAYKLMVWHEGAAKPVERTITVPMGGTATAALSINVAAARE